MVNAEVDSDLTDDYNMFKDFFENKDKVIFVFNIC